MEVQSCNLGNLHRVLRQHVEASSEDDVRTFAPQIRVCSLHALTILGVFSADAAEAHEVRTKRKGLPSDADGEADVANGVGGADHQEIVALCQGQNRLEEGRLVGQKCNAEPLAITFAWLPRPLLLEEGRMEGCRHGGEGQQGKGDEGHPSLSNVRKGWQHQESEHRPSAPHGGHHREGASGTVRVVRRHEGGVPNPGEDDAEA
mmetsp:Transcript_1898/g.3398  ORF Transcript_1898/g.3398 Transcript_1898/m.3398 type:complete len:204 (-) Transcript_1898:146-757(-)